MGIWCNCLLFTQRLEELDRQREEMERVKREYEEKQRQLEMERLGRCSCMIGRFSLDVGVTLPTYCEPVDRN